MNIFQRIVLLLGAIGFVFVLWTSPKVIRPRGGGVYKWSPKFEESKELCIYAPMMDTKTASIRGAAVLGATGLVYFVLSSRKKKEGAS